ncbi:MAG: dehydratase [Chloroflexi bacterium]|nr:dehydratase [Chloroflexota bacterium]
MKTLYWEDVKDGQDLPTLKKNVSTQQMVKYAGASLDFYQIHYDKDFAISTGLNGLIVHGALKSAFLAQLLTDWIGPNGTLRKLSVQYRGMDVPNDPLTCKGVVKRRYVEGEKHFVDCDVWMENGKGEKTTPAAATVILPSKNVK